ncbi:MAG: integration host factor subunit alpha [Trichlorobacter sp.]|jgi:integration host factor subunit alpha
MTLQKEKQMTKADLAEKIHTSTGLSKKDSSEMMQSVFAIMKESLETGEIIKLAGFGSFVVSQKAARKGRNPQTGEAITIGPRRVLSFKPSTVLKQAINREHP